MTSALEDLKRYRDGHLREAQQYREDHDYGIKRAKECLAQSCEHARLAQEADDMLTQLGEVKRWADG